MGRDWDEELPLHKNKRRGVIEQREGRIPNKTPKKEPLYFVERMGSYMRRGWRRVNSGYPTLELAIKVKEKNEREIPNWKWRIVDVNGAVVVKPIEGDVRNLGGKHVPLTRFIGAAYHDAQRMCREYNVPSFRFIGPNMVSTADCKPGRLNLELDEANAVVTNAYFE